MQVTDKVNKVNQNHTKRKQQHCSVVYRNLLRPAAGKQIYCNVLVKSLEEEMRSYTQVSDALKASAHD